MSNNPTNEQQQAAGLTQEQITAIVKAAIPQQQPQQVQQRQPSQDEIAKMLNRYEPDDAVIEMLFGEGTTPENRKKALNALVRGAVTEAITVSRYQAEHMGELLSEAYDEPLSYAREYGQEKLFDGIYKDAPGLKSFDGLVRQLADTFSKDAAYPKSRSERPKFLQERITAALKQSIPDFDPAKGVAPTQPKEQGQQGFFGDSAGAQPQNQPRVPAGGSGGQGGGTGAPAGGGKESSGQGGPSPDKPFGF